MRTMLVALLIACGSLTAGAQTPNYDLNGDGKVDIADVVTLVNAILNNETSGYDLNGDGKVNADDLVQLVNAIVSKAGESSQGQAPEGAVAVDLGLPSGTLWANMNVGAESVEDYGLFFAWGETQGYTSDTSDGHSFSWDNYKWCEGSQTTQTKYCNSSDWGTVDNKTVLDFEDDAAYVNWGSDWRMPTIEEMEELLNNTSQTWTTQNGVNGCLITATNGNTIFLPAAGNRQSSTLFTQGTRGNYWSSTLNNGPQARGLDSNSATVRANIYASGYRFLGYTVRPVHRKK